MTELQPLLDANRRWAAEMTAEDPEYFSRLAEQQAPRYLWIGCSDSRVPANVITGLPPGEVFVHRNIANVVNNTDVNCLSVVQFAVEELGVEHIIVCGHYGCGGVAAALGEGGSGITDYWLQHIRHVASAHYDELALLADPEDRQRRLCELHVAVQVKNLCRTAIVRSTWAEGRSLQVHGWIYAIEDGLLTDLGVSIASTEQSTHTDLTALGRPQADG